MKVGLFTPIRARVLAGIVTESDEELTIRMVGGVTQKVKKSDVAKREKMKASLMPEGLHLGDVGKRTG